MKINPDSQIAKALDNMAMIMDSMDAQPEMTGAIGEGSQPSCGEAGVATTPGSAANIVTTFKPK